MPCGPDTFDVEIICGECRFTMPLSEERARYCGIDLERREIAAKGVLVDRDGVTFDLPRGLLRHVPEPNGVCWATLWKALCELAGAPTNAAVTDPRVIQALLKKAPCFSALLPRQPRRKGRPRGTHNSNEQIDLILNALRVAPKHTKSKTGKCNLAQGIKQALKDADKSTEADPESLRRAINRWLKVDT